MVRHNSIQYNYRAAQFHRTLDIPSFIATLYNFSVNAPLSLSHLGSVVDVFKTSGNCSLALRKIAFREELLDLGEIPVNMNLLKKLHIINYFTAVRNRCGVTSVTTR
jgi:hypothetical protein